MFTNSSSMSCSSYSYKEQSLIHIALALIYDTTMVVPRNKKKQFEIVRSLRTIFTLCYNSLNICNIQVLYKIVRKLRTICL